MTARRCKNCGRFFHRRRDSDYCSHGCYRHAWGKSHPELEKSYKDRYRLENPEKVLASSNDWRSRNLAHVNALAAARRKRNLDEHRAKDRAYYRKLVGRPLIKGMGRPRLASPKN
jgi:hypothetical protein